MALLCTYILTKDTGLAPNPYWGWCTLAVCTPNRQGANLAQGDWIAGFSSKAKGNNLIYVMEIKERIHMDDYFKDLRFKNKKPNLQGDWQDRCGDNFHSLEANGEWRQHRNRFHIGPQYQAKDTRHPFVFAARKFWYFGRESVPLPPMFLALIGGRGIRTKHPEELVQQFLNWLASSFEPGIHGLPSHNPDLPIHRSSATGRR